MVGDVTHKRGPRLLLTVCSHCPWRGMVPPPQVECSEIILIRQSMSWSAITLLFPVQHFHDMKFIQYWSSVFILPVLITIVKHHTALVSVSITNKGCFAHILSKTV